MKGVGGRNFNKQIPEFGECVMHLKTPSRKWREKFEPRWESGIFLRIDDKSQELITGAKKGVVRSEECRIKGREEEKVVLFHEANSI